MTGAGSGLGRHHEVAGQRQRHPRPGRRAVDRGHDRFGQLPDRGDDRVVPPGQDRVCVQLSGLRVGRALLEIGAGAERPSGAGEQHRADLLVMPDLTQHGEQVIGEPVAPGVHPLRPVQHDLRRRAVTVQVHRLVPAGWLFFAHSLYLYRTRAWPQRPLPVISAPARQSRRVSRRSTESATSSTGRPSANARARSRRSASSIPHPHCTATMPAA